MVAGFDRYFQLARCFRDEDLRADRQPEFTQIDVEASFVTREDIMAVTEGLLRTLFAVAGFTLPDRVPRMSVRRCNGAVRNRSARSPIRPRDRRRDQCVPRCGLHHRASRHCGGRARPRHSRSGSRRCRHPRKQLDEIEAVAKTAGAAGLLRLRRSAAGLEGAAAKFLPAGAADRLGLAEGELGLYVAASDAVSSPALDRVRHELARRLGLVPQPGTAATAAASQAFVWVFDFPMFDRDTATGRLAAVHHPFTAPHPDDVAFLATDPTRARAVAYDIVVNGMEIAGGSIRISDPSVQEQVFSLLGIDEATAKNRFGFLLEGLRSGAPPHGGIAFGFDRIAMLLSGATSLRDVIAFPKTTAARALFEGAPAPVPPADLSELHIRVD